jgi:hypothetical protein
MLHLRARESAPAYLSISNVQNTKAAAEYYEVKG